MQKYKLSEVFESQITGEWGKDLISGKGTQVIRTTNFTNEGIINYENIIRRDIAERKIASKTLKQSDIIIEKSGGTDTTPTGRVVYCNEQIKKDIFLCNNFTQALRTDIKKAFPKFVFYAMWYLHKIGFTNSLQSKTTGIRNLQLSKYLETEVLFPPLPEQERIAAELDAVSGILAKQKEQEKLLNELIKSKFHEMFNGNKFELKFIKELLINDISKIKKAFGVNDVIQYIDISSIDNTRQIITGMSKYTVEKAPSRAQYVLNQNDIIISTVRPNLRNVAVIKSNDNNLIGSTGFCVLRCSEKVKYEYLFNIVNSEEFASKLMKVVKGANYPAVSDNDIKNIEIPLPPLSLQQQFADFVNQVEKSKEKLKTEIKQTETLYKALMQKYFGE